MHVIKIARLTSGYNVPCYRECCLRCHLCIDIIPVDRNAGPSTSKGKRYDKRQHAYQRYRKCIPSSNELNAFHFRFGGDSLGLNPLCLWYVYRVLKVEYMAEAITSEPETFYSCSQACCTLNRRANLETVVSQP